MRDTDDGPRNILARQLRNAVHQRVFGTQADPIRIGRYTVLKRLGQGGMGEVFAAYDTELDRKVAVKLLRQARDDGTETWRVRLRREAQALAKLSHPNVVVVYDVGEHGPQVFVSMEFIDGPNLRDWLDAEPRRPRQILDVFVQAGRGLAAAHAAGIVHRDFKPHNVIVGEDGRVRVLDFGLARGTGELDAPTEGDTPDISGSHVLLTPLTRSGAIMGTPAYMAPEQHLGEPSDERTDQFGFCVALFEALYGQRPFDGSNLLELRASVLEGALTLPRRDSRVPKWIRRILERGLARDPAARFPSMDELLAALLRDPAVLVRRVILGVSLVALAGVAAVLWQRREDRHAAEQARLSGEASSERDRAETAERKLIERADSLTLAEIDFVLERDPTRAVAMLLNLSDHANAWHGAARIIASDGAHRGVARRVQTLAPSEVPQALSPDGRWLVTRSPDSGLMHRIDLNSGQRSSASMKSTGVPVVAFGPQGEKMATLRAPEGVALWPMPAGEPQALGAAPGGHHAIAWSRGGECFASYGRHAEVHVWTAGAPATVRGGHEVEVEALAVHGNSLATVDQTGTVRLFDLAAGTEHVGDGLGPLRFGPEGELATATNTAGLQLLEPGEDGRLIAVEEWPGTDAPVRSIAFDDGAPRLAMGLADGEVVLWDFDEDRERRAGKHDDEVITVRFTGDGQRLVTQSRDRTLAISHLGEHRRHVLRGHDGVGFWALDEAAHQVVTVGWEGTVRHWALEDGALAQLDRPGQSFTVIAAGASVLAATDRGEVLRWTPGGETKVVANVDATIAALLPLPGEAVAIATAGGEVMLIDGDGTRRSLAGGKGEPVALGLAGDGGTLYAAAVGEGLRRFTLPGGQEGPVLQTAGVRIHAMAAAADGSIVAVGWTPARGTWRVDIDAQGHARRTDLGGDGIVGTAFDLERDRIAWMKHTRELFIAEAGEVRSLGQHRALVDAMAFDRHGDTLVAVGRNGEVVLLDPATGRRRVVELSRRPLRALAYAATGEGVWVAGDDGSIRLVPDDLPHEPEPLRRWIADATSLRVEAEPIQ